MLIQGPSVRSLPLESFAALLHSICLGECRKLPSEVWSTASTANDFSALCILGLKNNTSDAKTGVGAALSSSESPFLALLGDGDKVFGVPRLILWLVQVPLSLID